MCNKSILSVCFFFFGAASLLSAQSSANAAAIKTASHFVELQEEESTTVDAALFFDHDNKLLYIDFELLPMPIREVALDDRAGNELHQESVLDLPVNTIYELDCGDFRPGVYWLELRAHGTVMRKLITLE
jgi:hypothetical protein